jgi:hypothetical protein
MAPTLTAVRERTYNDTLEQDNADVLSSRLNDIGDPTKWVTTEEHFRQIKNIVKSNKERYYRDEINRPY